MANSLQELWVKINVFETGQVLFKGCGNAGDAESLQCKNPSIKIHMIMPAQREAEIL